MRKLYAKFFKWSRKKYREEHMRKHRNDIKCPNCKEWFSVSSIDGHKHSFVEEFEWGDSIRCGKCGNVSYWNYVAAPVALHCDENGNPIKDSK